MKHVRKVWVSILRACYFILSFVRLSMLYFVSVLFYSTLCETAYVDTYFCLVEVKRYGRAYLALLCLPNALMCYHIRNVL